MAAIGYQEMCWFWTWCMWKGPFSFPREYNNIVLHLVKFSWVCLLLSFCDHERQKKWSSIGCAQPIGCLMESWGDICVNPPDLPVNSQGHFRLAAPLSGLTDHGQSPRISLSQSLKLSPGLKEKKIVMCLRITYLSVSLPFNRVSTVNKLAWGLDNNVKIVTKPNSKMNILQWKRHGF